MGDRDVGRFRADTLKAKDVRPAPWPDTMRSESVAAETLTADIVTPDIVTPDIVTPDTERQLLFPGEGGIFPLSLNETHTDYSSHDPGEPT